MKKLISALIVLICLSALVTVATAADITFAWDANTEEDLAGYKLHSGNASGDYIKTIDVENVLEYTWTDIPDGEWFFTATAYDIAGNESDYSNEVSMTIDSLPPASPLNLKATINASKVTIETNNE